MIVDCVLYLYDVIMHDMKCPMLLIMLEAININSNLWTGCTSLFE